MTLPAVPKNHHPTPPQKTAAFTRSSNSDRGTVHEMHSPADFVILIIVVASIAAMQSR